MSEAPTTEEAAFPGRVQEICIVTADIYYTLAGLVKTGIGPFKIFTFDETSVTERTFRGVNEHFSLRVAFAEHADTVWEAMQPLEGASLMREFLDETGGRGGIQHVAFEAGVQPSAQSRTHGKFGDEARKEAQAKRRKFEDRGFPLVQSGLWHGKRGTCEFMFFDTRGAVGTCFEAYVFSDDWEEPDEFEVYPVPLIQ